MLSIYNFDLVSFDCINRNGSYLVFLVVYIRFPPSLLVLELSMINLYLLYVLLCYVFHKDVSQLKFSLFLESIRRMISVNGNVFLLPWHF